MTPAERTSQLRALFGKIAALCMALFFSAMLDGLIAELRRPDNTLDMIAGASEKINGRLPETVQDADDLVFSTNSDSITFSFDAIHPGFWTGGRMWRGIITTGADAAAGNYNVTVEPRGKDGDGRYRSVFTINIYKDTLSYRKHARPWVVKYLGISSWALAVPFLISAAAAFGLVYFLSQRREQLLAREGKAEVYMLKRGETSFELAFGLGTAHGAHPGTRLILLKPDGQPLGYAQVVRSTETDSLATADLTSVIEPGCIVKLDR